MALILRTHRLHLLRRLSGSANGCPHLLPSLPDRPFTGDDDEDEEEEEGRRGDLCGRLWSRKWPLHRPPVSLPCPHHPPPHRRIHRPRRQAPPLLPRSFPRSHPLQELLPPPPPLTSPISRSFSSASLGLDPDPIEDGGETSAAVSSLSRSDLNEEADLICKIIDELLAAPDLDLEAALDECGIDLSPTLVAQILERFRHAHKPAQRFFRWAGGRQGFSHGAETYNKMVSVLGRTRQFETMVALLDEMGKNGFLTMDSFKIAIKSFAASKEMKRSIQVFHLMRRFNVQAGLETFNCLIEALAKSKLGKEAQALFEKMKDQYPPDLRTYTLLLLGWCRSKNLVEAEKVWNEMLDRGFKPDVVAHNTMLDGLIRAQKRSDAIKLFQFMKDKGPKPNARTYTIIVHDLCKGGEMDLAMNCFEEMLAAGCNPDAATYTCLILGFGNARQMDKVSILLNEMSQNGCPPDCQTYNALIKLMTSRNMPDAAAKIYEKMITNGFAPTIHTYNMMMKSCFHGHNYEMGCALWKEMGQKGICPDVNSYTVLVEGHIRHGRIEDAYKYIEEMTNKGMRVPQFDYNKFAADFSKGWKPVIVYDMG